MTDGFMDIIERVLEAKRRLRALDVVEQLRAKGWLVHVLSELKDEALLVQD